MIHLFQLLSLIQDSFISTFDSCIIYLLQDFIFVHDSFFPRDSCMIHLFQQFIVTRLIYFNFRVLHVNHSFPHVILTRFIYKCDSCT